MKRRQLSLKIILVLSCYPNKMTSIEDLEYIIKEKKYNTYLQAIKDAEIRRVLEIEQPEISDFSKLLHIENGGKLYAIRMDLNKNVDNHKKSVVAGLILQGVMNKDIPRTGVDTLIDGGNYNSAKAVKYYTEKFGMKGTYVMSRLFKQKQDILDMLKAPHFNIIIAPEIKGEEIEKEFYKHLVQLMTQQEFRKNKHCLWHAKKAGEATYPLGLEIAAALPEKVDYTVSCLGAGATLEGIQIAIKDYNRQENHQTKIILAEHELSPLFAKSIAYEKAHGTGKNVAEHYPSIKELPHFIVGPHFQGINPLLSDSSIAQIDKVMQYSTEECYEMQQELLESNIGVGNSSAANISVAKHLANQGEKVVTVVFEPYRSYCVKK